MTDERVEAVARAIDDDLARQASVQSGCEYHRADECGVAVANMNVVVSELARAAISAMESMEPSEALIEAGIEAMRVMEEAVEVYDLIVEASDRIEQSLTPPEGDTVSEGVVEALDAEDEDEMVRDVQAWLRDNPPDSRERRALKRLFDACKYHDPDDWSGEPAMIEAAQVLGEPPFGARP